MADTTLIYHHMSAGQMSQDVLAKCRALFNDHYGFWSPHSPQSAGERIRLPTNALPKYLDPNTGFAAYALGAEAENVVGYAFATRVPTNKGPVSWVTQLVVHTDYQNKGVAKRLLRAFWAFSDDRAWGLVSANPFAIRALEKATRRRCDPQIIEQQLGTLAADLTSHIHYLKDRELRCSPAQCVADTKFFVDHSAILGMLDEAKRAEPWLLGPIAEGEEWLAVTFNTQSQFNWSKEEWASFWAADKIEELLVSAYDRMAIGQQQSRGHAWARHAETEVEWLVQNVGLSPGQVVLDFGCGLGRHSIALATKGFHVVGVDFSTVAIEAARKIAADSGRNLPVEFVHGDCRRDWLDREFDAGLCLYDVVGSFPGDTDNQAILENLSKHLKKGAPVAISAMNLGAIERSARRENVPNNPNVLLELPPSSVMEDTGNIFDPKFLILDPGTKVVYRRERFVRDDELPLEVFVRDRRYHQEELRTFCENAGFATTDIRPVRSGAWNLTGSADSTQFKELLYIGRKA